MAAQFLSSVAIFLVALRGATAFPVAGGDPRPSTARVEAALSRRDFAFAAPAAAALLAGLPMPAAAAPPIAPDKATAAKFAFNGVFRDNKHPQGYRIIAGGANKAGTGTVTLKDTPTGQAIETPMIAKRDAATGQLTLNMDLSAYGSTLPDNNGLLTWFQVDQNPKLSNEVVATVNERDGSIRFPDGNVWRKEGGLVGVYIDGFAPYPKFRRLVLPGKDETLASVVMVSGNRVVEAKGADLSVVMVSGKKVIEASGVDLGKRGLQVQFPGKACAGTVDRKKGTIAWADGNVWTKV